MYYISLFIEKIVTTNVKQRILTLILPLVMAVTTFALDPSVYSVKSVMDYLFIFVLLFSLVTGFRELKVSEDNAFVVIGNHSYVIYLIHATLLGAVFYLMNATGLKYGYVVHIVTVFLVIPLLTGLSEILRSAVSGMRGTINRIFK